MRNGIKYADSREMAYSAFLKFQYTQKYSLSFYCNKPERKRMIQLFVTLVLLRLAGGACFYGCNHKLAGVLKNQGLQPCSLNCISFGLMDVQNSSLFFSTCSSNFFFRVHELRAMINAVHNYSTIYWLDIIVNIPHEGIPNNKYLKKNGNHFCYIFQFSQKWM